MKLYRIKGGVEAINVDHIVAIVRNMSAGTRDGSIRRQQFGMRVCMAGGHEIPFPSCSNALEVMDMLENLEGSY